MRIIITGGSGFIGKWFVRGFADEHELIVLGRNRETLIPGVKDSDCTYLQTDYSTAHLCELLQGSDAVVHLAAKRTGAEDLESYWPNMALSYNLFDSCLKTGIKNVVALSTISVYSPANPLPWSEDQKVSPLTLYGISKVTMENLAEYYNQVHNLNIKCLRVAQVLGLYERSGFMLNTFIEKACRQEKLKVYGKGEGRREYIYVKDVAGAINKALDDHVPAGIFNIGTGVNISHLELGNLVNDVFDNKGNLSLVPGMEEDKSVYLMDISKAENIMGWIPKWSLVEGLTDIKAIMAG